MRLNVRASAASMALIWGVLGMFLTGLAHIFWTGYGQAFLNLMASVYPGFHATPSFRNLILGLVYGLLDGAVFGALFAWLYNCLAAGMSRRPHATAPAGHVPPTGLHEAV